MLYAAVAVNLGILGIFKYLTFLVQTVDRLPGVTIPVPSIVLPVGISFFTFQGLSYVIDVYRNERLKSTHFRDVLLYIALFPQLVAGPIIRYEDVADEIHSRRNTLEQLAKGLRRVYCGPEQEAADRRYLRQCCSTDLQRRPLCAGQPDGLAGRGVLSDADLFRLQRIQRYGHRPGLVLWVPLQGKLQLSVHLGQYSGILAQMAYLPFHLVPGIPVYPIGRQPEGQGKDLLEQADRVFLHGLWHGANWTFIVWGLWHGFFIVAEDAVKKLFGLEKHGKGGRNPACVVLKHLYTLLVVLVGFVIFRADNMGQAFSMIGAMFSGGSASAQTGLLLAQCLTPLTLFALAVGLVGSTPVLPLVCRKAEQQTGSVYACLQALSYAGVLALLLVDILHLSAASYVPFIYFQF